MFHGADQAGRLISELPGGDDDRHTDPGVVDALVLVDLEDRLPPSYDDHAGVYARNADDLVNRMGDHFLSIRAT